MCNTKGHGCVIFLNVHVPAEDKSDDKEGSH
jgi:hypothetical protein